MLRCTAGVVQHLLELSGALGSGERDPMLGSDAIRTLGSLLNLASRCGDAAVTAELEKLAAQPVLKKLPEFLADEYVCAPRATSYTGMSLCASLPHKQR